MSQVNKKLYIITTRSLNKEGFLNESICNKKQEVSDDSPVMQYLIGDIDEALVSWIFALSENKDNKYLSQVLELLGINDLSQIEDPNYLMSVLTEDKKSVILHQFGNDFTKFERSNQQSPVENFNSTSYLEKDFDGGRVIALPHLAEGRNCCIEDNKKWIEALIKTFANENEEVRLILHDKDLYGYSNVSFSLLKKDRVKALSPYQDINIFVFQHGENDMAQCLEIKDFLEGIDRLENIFNKKIAERAAAEDLANM